MFALAVVFWLLVIGADAALPLSEAADDHTPHAVAATVQDEFAVVMDHPHFQQDTASVSPEIIAAAVTPRAATALVFLGLAAIVVAAWMSVGHAVWLTVRGPPRGMAAIASGRQLLAQFCVARR